MLLKMNKLKRFYITTFSLLLIAFPGSIIAQNQLPGRENIEKLTLLSMELETEFLEKKKAAIEWAFKNNVPVRREFPDGRIIELQYLDENFIPVYFETRNTGAALSTSVNQLHPFGQLKLYLTGKGMTAGVWDGGSVQSNHSEMTSRVQIYDGGVQSNHATHVGGTIIAKGVQPAARGMAPEGKLISYDWNSDLSEMAAAAANGLLISNHSYGLTLGWGYADGAWKWYAHADSTYDYRFGYYSGNSRALDMITYNAPNYLIVWAAGNDRNDTGDGTKPPDGPYNSIGPYATAKNVLTVGAVRKLTKAYANPFDVIMSDFSSWGPVNDGRIKPDIVGAGVQLYSSISNNEYGTYSGTSMASPNVTGSLLLLQQLYNNLSPDNSFMRAATLKGLAIHTAHEAGDNPGPDYRFGWGLLNTGMAAQLLLARDNNAFFMKELTLNQGEIFELEFESDGSSDIIATISWTEAPGEIVAPPLSKSSFMLVNDLDLRIYNEAGDVVYLPWILNPQTPAAAASKGDNFRDNVEKINISAPPAGRYFLKVSHKGDLFDEKQDFSLILQTKNVPERKTLYRVGNEGSWSDPSKWSLSSGGEPAGLIPSLEDHVVFDNNSFSQPDEELALISLDEDSECYSFNWFSNQNVFIEANSNQLSVFGPVYIAEENQLAFSAIDILLTGNLKNNLISIDGDALKEGNLIFNGEGSWRIGRNLTANSINLLNGHVLSDNIKLTVKEIHVASAYQNTFDLSYSTIDSLNKLQFLSPSFDFKSNNSELIFTDNPVDAEPAMFSADNYEFWHVKSKSSHLIIDGSKQFRTFTGSGILEIKSSNVYQDFKILPGAQIVLKENSTQEITKLFDIQSNADSVVSISSDGAQNATLHLSERKKLCFDFLQISKITATGEAVLSAGLNSIVDSESEGWLTAACGDILYPDFEYKFACKDGLTFFYDKSSGAVEDWFWEFDKNGSVETSDKKDTYTMFNETGSFQVKLAVSDESITREITKEISVRENNMVPGNITINGNQYTSQTITLFYQWFLNGNPIPGATMMTYENTTGASGTFQVLLSNGTCNILSNPLITSITDNPLYDHHVAVYPNPFQTNFTAEYHSGYTGSISFQVIDIWGRVLLTKQNHKNEERIVFSEDLSAITPGIYFIRVVAGNETVIRKLIKTQ